MTLKEHFEIETSILHANWCIKCLPKKVGAQVVKNGDSLCLKHFQEIIEKLEGKVYKTVKEAKKHIDSL